MSAGPAVAPVRLPLEREVEAADYLLDVLGPDKARLVLVALRAGWLTRDEALGLEPFAVALGYVLGAPVPAHRGKPSVYQVAR